MVESATMWHNSRGGSTYSRMTKNIGFVSTRFAGTDGVSLESSKWAHVLAQNGYRCFWFGGEVDRNPRNSVLVPEAHFKHEQVQWINTQVYGKKGRSQTVTRAIHAMRSLLKSRLHDFVHQFNIDQPVCHLCTGHRAIGI